MLFLSALYNNITFGYTFEVTEVQRRLWDVVNKKKSWTTEKSFKSFFYFLLILHIRMNMWVCINVYVKQINRTVLFAIAIFFNTFSNINIIYNNNINNNNKNELNFESNRMQWQGGLEGISFHICYVLIFLCVRSVVAFFYSTSFSLPFLFNNIK